MATLLKILLISSILFLIQTTALLTDEEKKLIVDVHNNYRAKLVQGEVPNQPVACDMKMLTWDDALAKTAQTWADACKLGHDTNSVRKTAEFKFVGQNYGASWNIQNIMDAWFIEHKNYDYTLLTCSGVCGHYTQMIWANTTKIGCAATDCSAPEKNFKYGMTFVCNYGEAGNWNNYKPYITCETGKCSLCAEGTTCNSQKLCAKDCIFPFSFKGQWYNECVPDSRKWCSFDRMYSGSWKYC